MYLLDHQYTPRNLAWSRLKNGDAVRAEALRHAAERIDAEVHLALADVHETWSCIEETPRGRYWGRWYERWEDEEEPEALSEPTLVDLQESHISLRELLDPSGERLDWHPSDIEPEEICATRASVELEPFASEHEGYMGNWGNTVDRWYHRAAVVLWPRARSFAVRAETSAPWALRELSRTVRAGRLDEARAMARQLLPFWKRTARAEEGARFADSALRVAHGLEDPDLAAGLLEPLRLGQITGKRASRLVALLQRYGRPWLHERFRGWRSSTLELAARRAWTARLPELAEPLAKSGDEGRQLVGELVAEAWAELIEARDAALDATSPKRARARLADLGPPALGLLDAARAAGLEEQRASMVEALTHLHLPRSVDFLVGLLRQARRAHPRRSFEALGLEPIRDFCARRITAELEAPPRADDDWSIRPPPGCGCEICVTLGEFLAAPDRVRFEWPLAKQRRRHVHGIIDGSDLPVTHRTRRQGRPYVLVLTKTRELFTREAEERRRRRSDLAWLTKRRSRRTTRTGRA